MTQEPTSPQLTPAPVSFAVALRPSASLRRAVASASSRISAELSNSNVVDEEVFPAHVSLYLGGTTIVGLRKLEERLGSVVGGLPQNLDLGGVALGNRGFVYLEVHRTPVLMACFSALIAQCAEVLRLEAVYRPHLIQRWSALSNERQALVRTYGTYKLGEAFDPHISIASVAEAQGETALRLAQADMPATTSTAVEALDLVDVGHDNERWRVLRSWGLSAAPGVVGG